MTLSRWSFLGAAAAAGNAGASPLIANRTAIGSWEQFTLITD